MTTTTQPPSDSCANPVHHYILAGDRLRDQLNARQERVVARLTQDVIQIGCATITVEAAKWILTKHAEHFAEKPNVVFV